MERLAVNDSIKHGIAEHARFHTLCSMHHNDVVKPYKIYSRLQVILFIVLVLTSIAWLATARLTNIPDDIAVRLLIAVPVITMGMFLVDHWLLRLLFRSPQQRDYINEMPHRLLRADLYSSEKRYHSETQPNGIVPDQLFLNDDAEIVIVDTKTRNRLTVHKSDIEQIVKYAKELSNIEYRRICRTAYIRCVTPRVTRFLPIKLRF